MSAESMRRLRLPDTQPRRPHRWLSENELRAIADNDLLEREREAKAEVAAENHAAARSYSEYVHDPGHEDIGVSRGPWWDDEAWQ